METQPPHELTRRAMAGDRAALESLWREHRRWLAVVILAHKPAEWELDDLLQEVALAVVRRIGELEEPQKLRPWLRTVALNAARSAGRKSSVRRRHIQPLNTEHGHVADPAAARAHAAMEARITAERVLKCAHNLEASYREPLLLRCVEGLSQREIATTLEIPESTVETRLARARRMLRRQIESESKLTPLMGLAASGREQRGSR